MTVLLQDTADKTPEISRITAATVVADARECIGAPWVHQGRSIEVSPGVWSAATGIDCLGLIIHCARKRGLPTVGDRTDYPDNPDGIELRAKLALNMIEVSEGEPFLPADVPLIRLPGDEIAKHIGFVATGLYERMLVHSFNGWSMKRVIEEPIRRWEPYIVARFRFPGLVY